MKSLKTLLQGLLVIAALGAVTAYADETSSDETSSDETKSDENFRVASDETTSDENFKAILKEIEEEAKNS